MMPVRTPNHVLVLNCGSSSIKSAVFACDAHPLPREPLWRGQVQGIGSATPGFSESGVPLHAVSLDREQPYAGALELIRHRAATRLEGRRIGVVAHRVVHGAGRYFDPVVVDAGIVAELEALVPLAPLHQPFPLTAMRLLLEQQPGLLQVACFDTAFHRSVERVEQQLPLPGWTWEQGLRRYGFHGLSYEYMSHVLPEHHGAAARGRVIVAHLGSGASLCAMRDLRSIATTMGFSALDGLMMGTRSGSLDPGVLLHLLKDEGFSAAALEQLLYQESGLLGVSGISAEPRELLRYEEAPGVAGENARLALAMYVRRIVREIGALIAILGGLDLLVFTAGVGENNAFIRERVCRDLAWTGMRIDARANINNDRLISVADSPLRVGVEPTNEEWVVARHALALAMAET